MRARSFERSKKQLAKTSKHKNIINTSYKIESIISKNYTHISKCNEFNAVIFPCSISNVRCMRIFSFNLKIHYNVALQLANITISPVLG